MIQRTKETGPTGSGNSHRGQKHKCLQGDYITERKLMTKEELKDKLEKIMLDANNISLIEDVADDITRTGRNNELSETLRQAAMIGYGELLNKIYSDIRFIWIGLYKIIEELEKEPVEEEAQDDSAV